MAVPRGFVVTCPGCEVPLEMNTCGWEMAKAVNQSDGERGMGIQITAWVNHECHKGKH